MSPVGHRRKVLQKTFMESYNIYLLNKMGIFNEQSDNQNPFARGIQGAQGVGLNLTADGNYDMVGKKKLTNLDDFDSIYNASQMLQINTGSVNLSQREKEKQQHQNSTVINTLLSTLILTI